MPEIKTTVTRTVEVEMRPYLAFLYFDDKGKRRVAVQYGEYHDGVLHRALALQDAPEEAAEPVLSAVYAAMEAQAKATLAGLATKDPAEYDANEQYLAALLAAGGQQ